MSHGRRVIQKKRKEVPLLSWCLDLLFPPRCIFCHKILQDNERYVCKECGPELPWTWDECTRSIEGIPVCVSPLWYRDDVIESFHRYKFRGRSFYAPVYGHLMAQCVQEQLEGAWDLITWAPLSAKRRARRGYDQAGLLAQTIAEELNSPIEQVLQKKRNITEQSGLKDDAKRKSNVRGVYRVTKRRLVKDKRILLVDDIVTTGSTLSECARVLLEAGASEIMAVTFARAR